MSRLAAFALAITASLVLYVAVFSIVRRPLTIGEVPAMIEKKRTYARSLSGPKIIVFAGSNGRYSHRCETIAQATRRPCANLSLAVGIGLDFQFTLLDDLLQPGDLVYLPLEYSQYAVTREQMEGGTENVLLVQYYSERLGDLEPRRIVRAWAAFDLPFLMHGLVETALAAGDVRRRSGIDTLTPQGDERGHTAERGRAYRGWLQATQHHEAPLDADTHAQRVIARFAAAMRARGVLVVGGLPTLPHGAVVPATTLSRVRDLWTRHGHGLLELPGGSRYPLDCFYDTHSHLAEECQVRHSHAVGAALARRLREAAAA